MNPAQDQLLAALADFWQFFPNFRFGQMICNLTNRAKEPDSQAAAAEAMWDIEDEELLAAVLDWSRTRREQTRAPAAAGKES